MVVLVLDLIWILWLMLVSCVMLFGMRVIFCLFGVDFFGMVIFMGVGFWCLC